MESNKSTDERFSESDFTIFGPLKLGALIRELERLQTYDSSHGGDAPKLEGRFLQFDFAALHPHGLHSYRGYYDHLAVGYESSHERNVRFQRSGLIGERQAAPSCRVPEFLKALKNAIGGTYTGWKGGEYTMDEETPIWVADSGDATGTGITGIQLESDYLVILKTEYCR